MNLAIQKSEKGYRVVGIAEFTDDEGNPAAEILSVFNQAEVEWYSDPGRAIDDMYDLVRQPAPWSIKTTVYHGVLGPSVGEKRNIAYWIKEQV